MSNEQCAQMPGLVSGSDSWTEVKLGRGEIGKDGVVTEVNVSEWEVPFA